MGWGREAVEDENFVWEAEGDSFLDEEVTWGLAFDFALAFGFDLAFDFDLEVEETFGRGEAAVVVGGRRRPVRRQRARRNLVGSGKFKAVRIWLRGRRSRDKNGGYLGETEEVGVELLCVRG